MLWPGQRIVCPKTVTNIHVDMSKPYQYIYIYIYTRNKNHKLIYLILRPKLSDALHT